MSGEMPRPDHSLHVVFGCAAAGLILLLAGAVFIVFGLSFQLGPGD